MTKDEFINSKFGLGIIKLNNPEVARICHDAIFMCATANIVEIVNDLTGLPVGNEDKMLLNAIFVVERYGKKVQQSSQLGALRLFVCITHNVGISLAVPDRLMQLPTVLPDSDEQAHSSDARNKRRMSVSDWTNRYNYDLNFHSCALLSRSTDMFTHVDTAYVAMVPPDIREGMI